MMEGWMDGCGRMWKDGWKDGMLEGWNDGWKDVEGWKDFVPNNNYYEKTALTLFIARLRVIRIFSR